MIALEKLIILPSPAYLALAHYLILGASLTFFPFAGMVVGGTIFSLFTPSGGRRRNTPVPRDPAREMMRATLLKPTTALVLCFVPLCTVGLITTAFFHLMRHLQANYWPAVLILTVSGCILLLLYSSVRNAPNSMFGSRKGLLGMGAFLLLSAYLLTVGMTGIYMNPEMWLFANNPVNVFVTWNTSARVSLYLLLSIAMAGGRLLQSLQNATQKSERHETGTSFSENVPRAVTLTALVLLPPALIADLTTLPVSAVTPVDFVLTGAALLAAATAALVLLKTFRGSFRRSGSWVLLSILAVFLATVLIDHFSLESATKEETALLLAKAEAAQTAHAAKPAAAGEKQSRLVAEGETIYKRICSVCHRFDRRLVGPPYDEVVPKYRGHVENLKAFIRNPVKKHPDYPAMPKLGLKEEEIDAVAAFLLEKTKGIKVK
jgi:cytochrome c